MKESYGRGQPHAAPVSAGDVIAPVAARFGAGEAAAEAVGCYREDSAGAFLANWTHHVAVDVETVTLDGDYRLHVTPEFDPRDPRDPRDPWLRETVVDRSGDRLLEASAVRAPRSPTVASS